MRKENGCLYYEVGDLIYRAYDLIDVDGEVYDTVVEVLEVVDIETGYSRVRLLNTNTRREEYAGLEYSEYVGSLSKEEALVNRRRLTHVGQNFQ